MARSRSAEHVALETWTINTIAMVPGTTAMGLALLYRGGERTKGDYHPISQVVARLRKQGVIVDVAERCPHCGAARTRGQKNVPLRLTAYGMEVYLRQRRAA
jgi:hypothetical protein